MNLEEKFKKLLSECKLNKDFHEIVHYSLFPTGKLFRPRLCIAIAQDLNIYSEELLYYAFALEVHHTYTLIHDDLPCMDNDDMRRGRPSLHKQFNEWKALLAGDGLINLSYELISHIKSSHLGALIMLFAQYNGMNGLIYGQFLDLQGSKKTLNETLKLHELKTARLIQLAIMGPLVINGHKSIAQYKEFGEKLGLYFQIQDDLSELKPGLSKDNHEFTINLFLNYDPQSVINIYWDLKESISCFLKEKNLENTEKIFESYQEKMNNEILSEQDYLLRNFKIDISSLRN